MRRLGGVLAIAVLLVGGCTGSTERAATPTVPRVGGSPPHADFGVGDDRTALHGRPRSGGTGLRLVADGVLVDLDHHRRRRIDGLPAVRGQASTAFAVDGVTVVAIDCVGDQHCTPAVYRLDRSGTHARRLAEANAAAPGRHGIWLTRADRPGHCTRSEVSTSGRLLVAPVRTDCHRSVAAETELGLLTTGSDGDRLVDPAGGPDRLDGTVLAVSGRTVVASAQGVITVTRPDGRRTRLRTPSALGDPAPVGASPDGRAAAIEFGQPACPGPRQCLDLWVLDLPSARWEHVPSMPVIADLKAIRIRWDRHGRLVVAGPFDRDTVATWRPGQPSLTISHPALPSGQYAVLP